MSGLGFTWYPKDWWTSDTFYDLPPELRYLYMEIISLLYMNDGVWKPSRVVLHKRFGVDPGEQGYELLASYFHITDDGYWTHPSVNKRLKKMVTARENGSKGGAPKGNQNAAKNNPNNPKKQPKTTHLYKDKVKGKVKEKGKVKGKENNSISVSGERRGRHLFKNSPFIDFELFRKQFEGTPYESLNLEYYHEAVKNWSASKNKMMIDWIATVRNWMLRDQKDKATGNGEGFNAMEHLKSKWIQQ
jgi:hypothetical protein